MRGEHSIGAGEGQRYVFDTNGLVEAQPIEGDERVRLLVEEVGISEEVARRVPADRPTPPRPT